MAAPSYGTDLTTTPLSACDGADANWTEPTGFTVGTITLPETDYFIQNTGCLSKNQQTTGGNGAIFNSASSKTIPTDGAFFAWLIFSAPNALAAEAAGGMQMFVGSATSAFKQFYVRGSDTYPYGGWICIPVNPIIETGAITINVVAAAGTFTRTTGDFLANGFEPGMTVVFSGFTNGGNNVAKTILTVTTTVITVTSTTGLVNESGNADEQCRFCDAVTGAPSATRQYFGAGVSCPTFAPTKGNAFGLDIIRFGRGEARFSAGDAGSGYCTFAGFATQNDALANRWGLIQALSGGYMWQGLITLGYGSPSAVVDFRDSNVVVSIANTKRVSGNFNKIEIRNASSRVDLTNITFVATGTVSKGRLEVVDDCDVNISGCTFNGMDSFIFKVSSDVLLSTFLNCGIVTANSAKFNGTKFLGFTGVADASQLVWDTAVDVDGKIDGCTFTKGTNATHAIQLGTTSPTSVTIRNCTFNGYNAANSANDSTILVSRTGGTVTINVVSCVGNITYKSAGAIVVIASNPVSATLTVKDTAVPPAAIANARVLVLADTGGPMPYNVTVTSITNAGTTATVAHTAHNMATNDKVQIKGASLWQNNGVFAITKTNDNEYTYTLPEAPGSSPTGMIKATYVVLEGLTNASGQITMSRSFTSSQPVIGRARYSSGAPYKKTTDFTSTVSSSSGMDVTVQLLPDV